MQSSGVGVEVLVLELTVREKMKIAHSSASIHSLVAAKPASSAIMMGLTPAAVQQLVLLP